MNPWDAVSDGVLVATSRRDLTTSTLLVSDGAAVLVDPAWEPDELAALATGISDLGIRVVAGFSTHAHHDHLLWHPEFGDVPRWASLGTVLAAVKYRDDILEGLGPSFPTELRQLVGRVKPVRANTIPGHGLEARLIVHDAHTPGHTALWLPERRVLLAGDMLSDVELPWPENSSLEAYSAGLDLLRPAVREANLVVPGHGHPGPDAEQRWVADRRYIDALLEEEIPSDPRISDPANRLVHLANIRLADKYTDYGDCEVDEEDDGE